MFPRVLYVDESFALELDWFGRGALLVRLRSGDLARRADPRQRMYVLMFFDELHQLGQPISPSNPMVSSAMREFTRLLVDHPVDGPAWAFAFMNGPKFHAHRHVEDYTAGLLGDRR